MADAPTSIEYLQILISDKVIAELNSNRIAVVNVARNEIEGIELVKASESKRPFLQLLFGVAILIVGLSPIPLIVAWIIHGGTLFDVQVLLLFLVVVGGVIIYTRLSDGARSCL